MKRLVLLFLLFCSTLALAQRENTFHVLQMRGETVGEKTTDAQAHCDRNTNVPCVIVFDPTLAVFAAGVMPVKCSQCIWLDYTNKFGSLPGGAGGVCPSGASITSSVVQHCYTTMADAIAAVGASGGTVVFGPNYTETITTYNSYTQNNLTIRCDPGATFKLGANLMALMRFRGDNVTIEGCTFDGNSGAYTGHGLYIFNGLTTSSGVAISHNTFRGFAGDAIAVTDAQVTISQNSITSGGGNGITVIGNSQPTIMANIINQGAYSADAVSMGSIVGGEAISNFHVTDNTITGGGPFAIESGPFGSGNVPYNGDVSGNTIYSMAHADSTCTGGISMAGVVSTTVAHNTFLNYCGLAYSPMALETGGGSGMSVSSNVIWGGYISVNGQKNSTYTGNQIYALYKNTSGTAKGSLSVGSTGDGQHNMNLTFTGNIISRPGLLADNPNGSARTIWVASTGYNTGEVIADSNGNLQMVIKTSSDRKTGAVAPAWQTTISAVTVDNHLIWKNVGILRTDTQDYGIWLQCNAAKQTCSNILFTGNIVMDNGTSNDYAFRAAGGDVAANSDNIRFSGNQIVGWKNCYGIAGNTNLLNITENNDAGCTRGTLSASTRYTGVNGGEIRGESVAYSGGNLSFVALATPAAPLLTAIGSGGVLADSTSYCYKVYAFNGNGGTVASAETCKTTGVASGASSMLVRWNPVVGATGYHVCGRLTGPTQRVTVTAVGPVDYMYLDGGANAPAGACSTTNTTAGGITGPVKVTSMPTSCTSQPTGMLWSNAGVVSICP